MAEEGTDAERPRQALLDQVIFRRDLDEVHLLLDFISGRTDRNLDQLVIANPDTSAPADQHQLKADQLVDKLMEIRYPPSPEPAVRAQHAALLLAAKDKLTALASPARGVTIAYTSMFVWSATLNRASRRNDARTAAPAGAQGEGGAEPGAEPAKRRRAFSLTGPREAAGDSRVALAVEAFPYLVPHVRRFNCVFWVLAWFTVVWLLVAALTYWDAAHGTTIPQRIDRADRDRQTILQANPGLDPAADCAVAPASTAAAPCARLAAIDRWRRSAQDDLFHWAKCDTGLCAVDISFLRLSLSFWQHLMGSAWDPGPSAPERHAFIASLINVFNTYVLPVTFSLLGTLVRSFRAIQEKIRDSLLGPRDLILTMIGLAISCVAGLAVGLFFAPSSSAVPGEPGFAGTVTLSVSGVGFLAGYGAEAFFRMLDGLLERVFSPEPGNGAKPAK